MSRAVLISINPKWCQKIVDGEKTIEVRKTRPNLETPFKCYIYCTYGEGLIEYSDPIYPNHLVGKRVSKDNTWGNCCNGMVIGEFVCEHLSYVEADIDVFGQRHLYNTAFLQHRMCLSDDELFHYLYQGTGKKNGGWAWHIRKLCLYYGQKELSEFTGLRKTKFGYMPYEIKKAPQSWCYVED